MPLQPLLSSAILALAFLLAATAFNISSAMIEDAARSQTAVYGSADIAIELNSRSENRFMQTDDVYAALGDEVTCAGCYKLPAQVSGGTVMAAAADFEDICGIFTLEFTSYGEVNAATEDGTAFITEELAAQLNLGIGDTFSGRLCGYDKTYVIQGISPHLFLGDCDMLINQRGVVRLLAADSPFIAAMGEDFELCGEIYIDAGSAVPAECAARLKNFSAFEDKTISLVEDLLNVQSNTHTLPSTIYILVTFIAVTAAAVVFCCMYILAARRAEQNALFAAAGVRGDVCLALQCAEILLYWICGSVAGAALTAALSVPIFSLCGFEYIATPFGGDYLINGAKALAITLFTALLTAAGFYASERLKKMRGSAHKLKLPAVIVLSAVFIAAAVCTFATPAKLHLIFGVISCILFLLLAFATLPDLFSRGMRALASAKRSARTPCGVAAVYAVKNARSVKTLHNTVRLLAMILSSAVVLALVLASGYAYSNARGQMLAAEYLILNAGADAARDAKNCEGVESAIPFYFGSATDADGNSLTLISAEDYAVFRQEYRPAGAPEGNEAVISRAYAVQNGYSAGDKLQLAIEGYACELVVSGLINSPVNGIYFDSEANGYAFNALGIVSDGTQSGDELEAGLSATLARHMATIANAADFLARRTSHIEIYLTGGNLLFACLIIFSLTGIADNLYESYRSRRREFELYKICGMKNSALRTMKAAEIAITAGAGIIAGAVMAGVLTVLVSRWMFAYGVDLFCLLSL